VKAICFFLPALHAISGTDAAREKGEEKEFAATPLIDVLLQPASVRADGFGHA
jgi:hypothetical protein